MELLLHKVYFLPEYYELANLRMQFFHSLIRSILKASYSGIVDKEDKLLGGTIGYWSWEENWEGEKTGRERLVAESFHPVTFTPVCEQRLMGDA